MDASHRPELHENGPSCVGPCSSPSVSPSRSAKVKDAATALLSQKNAYQEALLHYSASHRHSLDHAPLPVRATQIKETDTGGSSKDFPASSEKQTSEPEKQASQRASKVYSGDADTQGSKAPEQDTPDSQHFDQDALQEQPSAANTSTARLSGAAAPGEEESTSDTPRELSSQAEPDPPDTDAEAKPESQPNTDPEASSESQTDTGPEAKTESQPDTQLEPPTITRSIRNRVCIDPQMHPTQTHAQFHHPGLLRGADFCDAGVECAPEVEIKLPEKTWHLFPFEEKVEGDESETPIIGWRHRALTGNDACADLLDVSQHRHQGHSSAVKIRPTYCLHTATATAHGGHPEASKIGPLCHLPAFEYPEEILVLSQSTRASSEPGHLVDKGYVEIYSAPPLTPVCQMQKGQEEELSSKQQVSGFDGQVDHELTSKDNTPEPKTTPGDSKAPAGNWLNLVGLSPRRTPTEPDSGTEAWPSIAEQLGAALESQRGSPHTGHSNISKVQQAPLEPPNPTLGVTPAAPDCSSHRHRQDGHVLIQSQHEGHTGISKVQPYIERGDVDPDMAKALQGDHQEARETASHPATAKPTHDHHHDEYWGTHPVTTDRATRTLRNSSLLRETPAAPTQISIRYLERSSDESQQHPLSEEDEPESTEPPRNPRPRQSSLSGKFCFGRTTSWFRGLLNLPEMHRTRLTDGPRKISANDSSGADQADDRREAARPRTLSGVSTGSIDAKFKRTFSNLERLLSEALALANEVVEQEDQRCNDDAEPCPVECTVVQESVPDSEASSTYDHLTVCVHDETSKRAGQKATMIKHAFVKRGPKHYKSVPGMRRSKVTVDIPARTSSLALVKDKIKAAHGLLVDAQRGRLQRQRSGHRLKEERSLPESHRHYVHGSKAMPTASLPKAAKERVARKSKSCHVPLNEHRGSHQSHDTRDGASDYQPKAKEAESRNRPAIASEGRSKSFGLDGVSDDEADWTTQYNLEPAVAADESPRQRHRTPSPVPGQEGSGLSRGNHGSVRVSLRGRTHVSLRGSQGFSLARGYRRQPVARDWPTGRKRFVATVACLSTALIGMLIGIYAGLVPSIQYYIADLYHYAIQGNVWFYAGLAVPTFFFWPLPLLHGRKPYILSSLILAMGLLFPQAIAVSAYRPPSLNTWRWALIGSRAFMGLVLGFASMNFHSILTDLFGASLMSRNPHQEVVDEYDVRRHGGGMGVWLGIWTWCFTGSLGVGFLIGAVIIDKLSPVWGFYVSIIMIAVVLLLNVVCPETRRSMYRRSVCEVKTGDHISRRVARGEVMMHRVKDGPKWWGEEVYHGVLLSLEMLRQPGFLVIAVYTGWIYANVVLAIVLLGSLTSQVYRFHSPIVGLCVSFISIGALVAVPFQKANLFSRGRSYQQTSADTFDNRITWTSHLLRRGIFCAFLPLVGIAYTIASGGTDIPVEVPTLFAAIIGYLSGLAISECNGFIMETFDTSDLQPGMTGRPRRNSGNHPKRTNYSSFPRVTAAFAICHALGFLFAACATFVGGVAQRHLGQQAATGTMAGIMLILTLLLLVILVRFKDVQIIPNSKSMEMDKWTEIRRQSIRRRSTAPKPGTSNTQNTMTDEEMWRPIIIGNPSSKIRRMNILELGSMTRWTEIRKKNKLIDERMAHLNRAALAHAAEAVEEATGIGAMATELVRRVSSRSKNRNARRFHGGSPLGRPSSRREGTTQDQNTPSATEIEPWPGTEDSSSQTTTQGTNFPDHWHGPGQALSEHVCVMGETVIEADEPRRSNDIGSEPWHETPEITITRPGDTPEPPR